MKAFTNLVVYILLGILWLLVKILPFRLQMNLGSLLGGVLFYALRTRREVARVNIGLCFPELAARDQEKMLRENFRSLGRGVFETGISWWASESFVRRLVTVEGVDTLARALEAGRGVLLVGGHFTTLDISCRGLGTAIDFDVSYRPFGIAPLDAQVIRGRQRGAGVAVAKDNFRLLLRRLKQNRVVWIAVDQADTSQGSVDARFFGLTAPSASSVARITQAHGCAVLPLFFARRENLSGYLLRIEQPLQDFPSGDPVTDAERLNAVVERHARQASNQYYWVHRRFKVHPDPYNQPERS